MNPVVDIEQFSSAVEAIYDAAIDQSLWPSALSQIADLVGADCAGIHFSDIAHEKISPVMHMVGFTESFNRNFTKHSHIWSLQSGLPFWKVGDVRHKPDIMANEELINGRFYKEVLSKENQDDYLGMLAVKDGTRLVPLTLVTKFETGPFGRRGIEQAKLLAPHICKSAKISFALELQNLKINQLETILDRLCAGIYLVHHDSRIMFMNKVAEQQVRRGRGLKIVNNRIMPKDDEAAKHLLHALSTKMEDSSAPVSIALPDENGGFIATVLHLDKGQRQNLGMGSVFAIFVQNPEVAPPIPGESFAKLYGLIQAELRIMLAMAPGLGPQDAADILGLSLSTVKTHLQTIFHKTNTNRQTDLMQLLMRSSAPLAAQ